jgi:DNA-3-methyladenine glycosylase I
MSNVPNSVSRCGWANSSDIMAKYHDEEWGVPIHNDQKLFEYLILETMQAGLSWSIILKRREEFRRVFFDFDVEILSKIESQEIKTWMTNPGIIRNQAKLNAVVTNAKAFLRIQSEFGSFDNYQWSFVGGRPIVGGWVIESEIPGTTDLSIQFSKDLKRRGFAFIGPTTCYAHMQATGLVDDHIQSCWRQGAG